MEGDNGAGKTTLLKVLSGLLGRSAGEVRLRGEPLTLARLSHQVALLGHLLGLKLELSALENLRFAIGLGGLRAGITPHQALKCGPGSFQDVAVRQLSAGQKKRVALARLLLVPAALWLLDEPYANLDRGASNWSTACSSCTPAAVAQLITSRRPTPTPPARRAASACARRTTGAGAGCMSWQPPAPAVPCSHAVCAWCGAAAGMRSIPRSSPVMVVALFPFALGPSRGCCNGSPRAPCW